MLQYYEQRHPEYEAIYAKPERQEDLAWLEGQIQELVFGKRVYEIACGTGYWTRRLAVTALSVHATDASQQLAAAAVSSCTAGNVTEGTADAFDVPESPDFDCVLAGFFFSHVRLEQQGEFLRGLANAFEPGTRIILFDNRYVEGSSTPISRHTDDGDAYQMRKLSDGSSHEVLKNFPTGRELRSVLDPFCCEVEVRESQYFWLATGLIDEGL
jgi:2-polyprenyl-3-methyl-5-hydroxy-6-metoxy-1,4-benzoquinol methylase